MRTLHTILPALLAGLLLFACDDGKPQGKGAVSDSVGQLAPPGETTPAQPAETPVDTSKPIITDQATITTDMGDIVIGLYGKDAPKAVKNFLGLAEKKFFEGIGFHRVVQGFVIQGGDPKSKDPALYPEWGTGGESIYGKEFEDELDPNAPSSKIGYVPGTVAMANHGPNTNSSQFFIVTGPGASSLPHAYTIFGTVTGGMDVVAKIEKAGVDNHGNTINNPPTLVRIKGVSVTEASPNIR